MKRANCMNVKLNTLLYIALFSGLGIFSFLLLINYATFSDRVADMLHSVSTLGFFILAFNVLGYTTIRLSSWIDNQYALNLHRRWKLVSVYIIVMGMFLLLNYGLMVTAKLLAGASYPFTFPNGGWRILITVWLVELVILGLLLANRSMRNTLRLQQKAAALQKENNTARYTALQNQLNPHFLLNTLNNIYALIAFDTDKAQQAVQELSKLLRYVLYDNQQTYVPLGKETDFIRNYIELMRIRLSSNVQMTTQIDILPDSRTLIAPLIFISLIENAFKHGISPTERSFIHIHLAENETEVICEISNSNHPKNIMDKSGSGIGLEQVNRRLEILYPGQYTWQKGISEDGKEYRSRLSIRVRESINK